VTRVVIDTSVFVSALIGKHGSAPDYVLRAFAEDKLAVVALDYSMSSSAYSRGRSSADTSLHATMVGDPDPVPVVTRDPADDYIVALARQEHVDAIVSVDLDLLDAGLQDLPVWTPRQLVEALPSTEQGD